MRPFAQSLDAHLGLCPDGRRSRELRLSFVDNAKNSFDLPAFAGLFLPDGHPDFAAALAERGRRQANSYLARALGGHGHGHSASRACICWIDL